MAPFWSWTQARVEMRQEAEEAAAAAAVLMMMLTVVQSCYFCSWLLMKAYHHLLLLSLLLIFSVVFVAVVVVLLPLDSQAHLPQEGPLLQLHAAVAAAAVARPGSAQAVQRGRQCHPTGV